MIRLMLADDHPLILNGIRTIIEQNDDIELVGEASDGRELLRKLLEVPADVVLLDINMPVMDGIETALHARNKFNDVKVLVFSQYDNKRFVKRVLKSGASGYLLKNAPADEVVMAIRLVYDGGFYLSRDLTYVFEEQKERQESKLFPDISKREMDVLKLICDEKNTQEIADTLCISPHTVETHRSNLLLKIGAKNTAGLVKWALENEILQDKQAKV